MEVKVKSQTKTLEQFNNLTMNSDADFINLTSNNYLLIDNSNNTYSYKELKNS